MPIMCEAPFQLSLHQPHLVDIEAQLSRELPKEDIFKRETIEVYPKVMPGKQMNCILKLICGRLDRDKREDWVELRPVLDFKLLMHFSMICCLALFCIFGYI